jgi:hypothetical protein
MKSQLPAMPTAPDINTFNSITVLLQFQITISNEKNPCSLKANYVVNLGAENKTPKCFPEKLLLKTMF